MSVNSATYPYSPVVYITDTIGGQGWQGSGVLISPDEVLTATHLVYDSSLGAATNIQVTPGHDNGGAPLPTVSASAVHYMPIDDANHTITYSGSQSDFALIHLSQPLDVGSMGYVTNFGGGNVHVTGYPASSGGQIVDSQQAVSADPVYSLLHGQTLGAGSSGGPVWVMQNGSPEVVGLVSTQDVTTGQGNFTEITSAVASQLQAWIAQDDGAASASDGIATFAAGNGNTVFTGATGQESVIFHGNWQDYSFAVNGGSFTASDNVSGRDGSVQMSNVQFLQFQDKTVIAAHGDDADVARIYSLFGRAPDQAGLIYWEDQFANMAPSGHNQALTNIVSAFTQSAEYQQSYGQANNSQFVSDLYQHVLGRAPDSAGLTYWTGALDGGASRQSLILGFVQSSENIARTDIQQHAATGWLLNA